MKNFLNKAKISFVNSSKGLENFSIIAWGWGACSYIATYFVFNNLIRAIDIKFFDILLSIFLIIYFIWHIFIAIKCFPKTPKLSREEKEKLKLQQGGTTKILLRKLFLQESITKMNPRNVLIAIDLFIILHFYSFLR